MVNINVNYTTLNVNQVVLFDMQSRLCNQTFSSCHIISLFRAVERDLIGALSLNVMRECESTAEERNDGEEQKCAGMTVA